PDQPLANSTTITLEFKNPIPVDASGRPTSQWLSSVPVTIHPALINISPQADVLDEAIVNEILQRLQTTSLIETPTPEALKLAFVDKKKAVEAIKTLQTKFPNATAQLINPILNAYLRKETTKSYFLSLAHIQNQNHSPIKLSLNALTNSSPEVKVGNLQLVNEKTISFDLESSNIKRLINAPIEIASELTDEDFDRESSNVHNIQSEEDSALEAKENSTITFIKPKFIVERTVGVPWSTSETVFGAKKHLQDPTKWDLTGVKGQPLFVSGWRVLTIGSEELPYLQVQPLFDPLVDMFPIPQVQSLTSLSFKVFDPDGYLYQKLYSKSGTDVDLYSYRLNKTKEESTR
ncbi:hypothetical protein R7V45_03990, partial [Mesomycoplasma ovipneumoniae]